MSKSRRDEETLSRVVPSDNTVTGGGPLGKAEASEQTLTARVLGETVTYSAGKPNVEGLDEADWEIGDLIDGRYEVTGVLGKGGMGIVYKVRHREWNIDMAVKMPLAHLVVDEPSKARFIREAQTWIELGLHPHVVQCWYVRELGGILRLFVDFLSGGSLKEWIQQGRVKAGEWGKIIDLAIQACDGLGYAHERGVIHRDVKPANMLMTEDGRLCVTDFGLVKISGASETQGSAPALMARGAGQSLTRTGSMLGTPEYGAPEQWGEAEHVDVRADIYSLGVVLYELCVGRRPFDHGSHSEPSHVLIGRHISVPPPDPRELNQEVPESLATLILKCIAKKPEDRPSSMAALRTELVEVHTQVVGEVYMRDPPQAAELRADALNNRAVSMWELDRKQDAFAAWKDAIQVDQLHLEAVYNQEVTRWREGQSSDLDVVQRLEQLRMELPAESREGAEASGEPVVRPLTKATRKRRARQERTAKKKQEHASATPEAESELALVSKRAQIGLYLGYVHLERASADEAETELVAALADPVLAKNGTAWVALGDAQMAQEKFAEAGSAYEAARTVMPADTLVRERGELSARAARSHDDRIQFPWFHCKRVLKEPGNQPISISPDGSLIVSVDAGALHNTLIVTDLVSGRCLRKVPAHTKAVRALAVTPDGRFVVSGSDDDSLRLWEISTGAREWTFQGYAKEAPDDAAKGVTSLAVTPDGRFVISGHKDKTIQMRDLTTGSCVRSLERQARGISALAITADGRFIVSGNDDGTLCVWDLNTGALLRKLRGHSQKISSLAVVRDHSMVISGGLDGTVRLWDPDAGTLLRTFEIRTHWVNAVAGTPNGRFVLSSSYHYSLERGGEVSGAAIRLWDWGTGACLRTINLDVEQAHTRRRGTVNALAVTPDGRFIISEGDDAALRMWELESDAPRHRAPLQVCRAQLHAAVDSSKRRFDEHLQVATSAVASDQIESAYHHLAKARSVEGYERDPRALALNVSLANCIPVVGLRNAWLQRTFETPAVVRAVAVTHDGCFAVSGSDDAVVRLWEIDTGTCKQTFKGHSKRVTCVAVVPDSRRVISGSDDGDLRLWDLNAASCVRTFAGHTDKVVAVAVTPDGRLALSASQRSVSPGQPAELRWWQLDSGVCSRAAKSLAREGTALAVTPDGRLAVAAGNTADRGSGSTLNLWDVMTGGHLRALEGHPSREAHPLKVDWGVLAVAVSPDGRFVVSASKDRTLALWELETGRRVRSFDGHTSAVNALTVTRDGRFAFSGSDDGTIRLWDLETGKCLRTLEQAAGAVSALALTPDGRFLISASNDISLWELDWELDVRMYVALPEPEKARRLNQVNAQRMAMQSAHRALAEAAQLTSRKSGLFARVASFFVRKGLG